MTATNQQIDKLKKQIEKFQEKRANINVFIGHTENKIRLKRIESTKLGQKIETIKKTISALENKR